MSCHISVVENHSSQFTEHVPLAVQHSYGESPCLIVKSSINEQFFKAVFQESKVQKPGPCIYMTWKSYMYDPFELPSSKLKALYDLLSSYVSHIDLLVYWRLLRLYPISPIISHSWRMSTQSYAHTWIVMVIISALVKNIDCIPSCWGDDRQSVFSLM